MILLGSFQLRIGSDSKCHDKKDACVWQTKNQTNRRQPNKTLRMRIVPFACFEPELNPMQSIIFVLFLLALSDS